MRRDHLMGILALAALGSGTSASFETLEVHPRSIDPIPPLPAPRARRKRYGVQPFDPNGAPRCGGMPRGSFWKPGPEHLPDQSKVSRQVKRRRLMALGELHAVYKGATDRKERRAARKAGA